jgi:uncharacterized membrane protein YhaH (DUF805 family)
MEGRISRKILHWVMLIWLCVEIGLFVKEQIPWGQEALFWPLWLCLTAIVALSAYVLDIRYANPKGGQG